MSSLTKGMKGNTTTLTWPILQSR